MFFPSALALRETHRALSRIRTWFAVSIFLGDNVYFGLMSRVFVNGPGDRGSIPGWVIPRTQNMVLDAALLNSQYYKVRIKSKV